MVNHSLISFGKAFSKLSKTFNLGNGSTWPGHIALKMNPHVIRDLIQNSKLTTIVIAGTNGKTTTAKLIRSALEENGNTVLQNQSGANLMNGIASTLLLAANNRGKIQKEYAIFEIDENVLPLFLKEVTPDYLVLLNLFRDQLDRYGEVHIIVQKWQKALSSISSKTPTLILNADDPQIAYVGQRFKTSHKGSINNIRYFGLPAKRSYTTPFDHAADSTYCPNCGNQLIFTSKTYSHLGIWHCPQCKLKHPEANISDFAYFPLAGEYNKYNTLAAVLTLQQIGIQSSVIEQAFKDFQPAFGRQEKVTYKGKTVQLFLSKNPTSFNQSFQTITNLGAKRIILILNDRIPDGRDISWIWDTELMGLQNLKEIFISGDRAYDMALRLKYELEPTQFTSKVRIFEDLQKALDKGVAATNEEETLFILPTYSAMLDARKILTGRKIL